MGRAGFPSLPPLSLAHWGSRPPVLTAVVLSAHRLASVNSSLCVCTGSPQGDHKPLEVRTLQPPPPRPPAGMAPGTRQGAQKHLAGWLAGWADTQTDGGRWMKRLAQQVLKGTGTSTVSQLLFPGPSLSPHPLTTPWLPFCTRGHSGPERRVCGRAETGLQASCPTLLGLGGRPEPTCFPSGRFRVCWGAAPRGGFSYLVRIKELLNPVGSPVVCLEW